MMSSHRGAPDSPLTPGGVESSVSYGRRPLRESLDIRALPPSRRPRPSGERQTGVTGRFPERRAEPTFLADEMSAPADFQVNDAVSEERTSGRSNALSVRTLCCDPSPWSLVPKPIPVLRPGQPTEHQLNHADPDLRLAGISQVFIILAVNPAPTQPAEGSLHHPPPRQQLKPSVPGKPADDLNHIPPVLRDPSVQGVIVVLGVRPQLPQARERFSRQLTEDLRCRRRIIHGRTGDGHG